jgi:polar amino acid transport system substrate-binding protein
MLRRSIALTLAVLTGTVGAAPAEGAAMVVHHVPLAGTGPDGTPAMPMAGRVTTWAHRAGLPLRWEAVPLKRSLQALQRNAEPLCVLGVFDTPERRHFARFSRPIHQEEQQVFLVAQRAAATLRALPDARTALLSPQLQLLVYDGVAYGATLDGWIAQRQPPPRRASASSAHPPTMLARGHADFTISVAGELREWQRRGEPHAQALETVLLPGMPAPPQRHLACSMKVAPEWMRRFDAAVGANPLP